MIRNLLTDSLKIDAGPELRAPGPKVYTHVESWSQTSRLQTWTKPAVPGKQRAEQAASLCSPLTASSSSFHTKSMWIIPIISYDIVVIPKIKLFPLPTLAGSDCIWLGAVCIWLPPVITQGKKYQTTVKNKKSRKTARKERKESFAFNYGAILDSSSEKHWTVFPVLKPQSCIPDEEEQMRAFHPEGWNGDRFQNHLIYVGY